VKLYASLQKFRLGAILPHRTIKARIGGGGFSQILFVAGEI
jgi:hypothetical protein